MPNFNLELEWIHQIQHALRSTAMDWFFIGWNYVESVPFILLIIAVIWYLINRKIGIKMFYILVLSGVLNKFFKGVFNWPRPCHLDPSVTVWICYPTLGFPSGTAQMAMIYFGALMIECRRKIYWLWGLLFALIFCFSRIYLGLHFFIDIFGGLLIGAILVLIYWKLFPLLESKWKYVIIFFPLLLLPFIDKFTLVFFWLSIGVGIGLLLPRKEKRKPWAELISVIIGCTFFLWIGYILFPKLAPPMGILAGFWFSYLGSKVVCLLNENPR